MEQGIFMDGVRNLFAFFDSVIYGLMRNIYNLIEQITHYKLFDSVDFFTDRIYIILSIFMLFKVSFSFINYLVNPDSFTDKEKGVQKVIINIIVMFIMLISCPWAFKQLWNLQDALISENVVARIVFGDESSGLKEYKFWDGCGEDNKSVAATNGDYLAIVVLRSFYRPYTALEIPNAGSDFADDIKDDICYQYSHGYPGIPERYLQSDIYNAENDDYYIINYSVPASTAVGVVVLLILISFAMDVGLRVIKLSFLEIFAPIPIVSYIDPSSGKNGMFKKWIKEVGSAWVGVFIRLLALYFAVIVIKEADSLIAIGDYPGASIWVELFIVIGALMFAKQLPKLIQNITGINLDGGFNINPLKKISDQALGGKLAIGGAQRIVRGVGGTAVGAGLGVVSAMGSNNGTFAQRLGHAAWSGVRGAGLGLFGNQRIGDIRRNQADYNRRMDHARRDGSTLGGRIGAGISEFLGTPGRLGDILDDEYQFDEEIRRIDTEDIEPLKEKIRNINEKDINPLKEENRQRQQRIAKDKQKIGNQQKVIDASKSFVDTIENELENHRLGVWSDMYHEEVAAFTKMEEEFKAGIGGHTAAQIAEKKKDLAKFKTSMIELAGDDVLNGNLTNGAVTSAYSTYSATATNMGETVLNDTTAIKARRIALLNDNTNINNNIMQEEVKIERNNTQISTFESRRDSFQSQIDVHENQKADIQRAKNALQPQKRVAQANSDNRVHGPHGGGRPGGGGGRPGGH